MRDGLSGDNRRCGRYWRRFVNRARAGLRHDHARSRRRGWARRRSNQRPRRDGLRGWRRGCGTLCDGSSRRRRGHRGRWNGRRACYWGGRSGTHRRHNQSRRYCWSRCRSGRHRRCGSSNRRDGLCLLRWRSTRTCRSYRRSGAALFADDRLQHIPGLGDVRQVNLCLDSFGFRAGSARGLGRRAFAGATQLDADFLRLILFQRTGVRLLLGHPYFGQYVENSFTLDFQLSGQIVDSNLTHPLLCASGFTL